METEPNSINMCVACIDVCAIYIRNVHHNELVSNISKHSGHRIYMLNKIKVHTLLEPTCEKQKPDQNVKIILYLESS